MYRFLWCLPLCLAVEAAPPPPAPLPIAVTALAAVADDGTDLPDAKRLERLAKTDPIAFIEACVRRYDREVTGYTATLRKQERINGRVLPLEVVDLKFREKPFSVLLNWRQGAGPARRLVYVKTENNGNILVKPAGLAGLIGIVERNPEGAEARKTSRYPLTEFGIRYGMDRTIAAWRKAREQNALHVAYLGIKPIKELNNRPCFVLQRTDYKAPEEDGITKYTTYIDKETWLQTGSYLQGAGDELIAMYFFQDVVLNPVFPPGTFTRDAIR
jgi:hypothetical protein